MLENIAKNISIKGLTAPELSRCRQFYNAYPQILGTLSQEFRNVLPVDFLQENAEKSILGLPSQELHNEDIKHVSAVFKTVSYSHLVELVKINDNTKRRFYELLILKTQLSVKELKSGFPTANALVIPQPIYATGSPAGCRIPFARRFGLRVLACPPHVRRQPIRWL